MLEARSELQTPRGGMCCSCMMVACARPKDIASASSRALDWRLNALPPPTCAPPGWLQLATVEDFEVQPSEQQLKLTLRVAQVRCAPLLLRAVLAAPGNHGAVRTQLSRGLWRRQRLLLGLRAHLPPVAWCCCRRRDGWTCWRRRCRPWWACSETDRRPSKVWSTAVEVASGECESAPPRGGYRGQERGGLNMRSFEVATDGMT